jgi:hypothetical protein
MALERYVTFRYVQLNLNFYLGVLFSFRLERLMKDVQAHSSFQHLDKVCLQFTVVHHFLVFMKFNL